MLFNIFLRKFHLWLGFCSGLIVFIVSITGCLYVFKTELSEAVYRDTYFIKQAGSKTLSLSLLQEKAQRALGKEFPVSSLTTYQDPTRAWTFGTYSYNPKAYTYFGQFRSLKTVFINPYTGQLNGTIDNKYEFFMLIKMLHYSLWLRTGIGQPIVGGATIVFIAMLLSGIFLIFRKEKGHYVIKQRFTIKWNASLRRLNFDLHNVPGFYFALLLLVIALTGLVIAFSAMWKLEYTLGNIGSGEKAAQHSLVVAPAYQDTLSFTALDKAFNTTKKLYAHAASITLYPPYLQDTMLYIYPNEDEKTIYKFDQLIFNSVTGEPLTAVYYREKNGGQKLNAMNYDIHAGSILGMPGKIIAFMASLVSASLPVTGFIIWWGRRRKTKLS